MANLNKVMLIGNVVADLELRYTPKGTAVTDLRMAVNRQWNNDQGTRQEETTFLDVTLWSRQAELAAQYLSKGRPVYIEGRLQMESWEDKTSGQKRSRLKIVGENMQFLGSAGGGGGERPQQQSAPQEQSRPQGGSPAAPAADAPAADDDDIPF
ncbi:MAG: single-stranded DNA-binding protein [Akkermansiaceae bacterium]|nr:single-stranded DNA-binding protein [Akkermansiaceae bacterium]